MGKKTVAIVGSNPLTRDQAPWVKGAIDIWLFNEAPAGWAKGRRCSALFQMHLPDIFRSHINRNVEDYHLWLQEEHSFPIYMIEQYPDVPSSVKFPMREIKRSLPFPKAGAEPKYYFTNSVGYAVALAIHQGYERIELYGVEMASETEYVHQRSCVMLWMGIALGMGIEFIVHSGTGFLDAPLYGYEGGFMVDRQLLETGVKRWYETKQEVEEKLRRSEIRMEETIKTLMQAGTQEEAIEHTKNYLAALKHHTSVVLEYGVASGCYQENIRYLGILDERIRAAGGDDALKAYEDSHMAVFAVGENGKEPKVLVRMLKKTYLNVSGNIVTVEVGQTADVSASMAAHLIKVGHAELSSIADEEPLDQSGKPVKFFSEMTKSELVKYAEDHGIEVSKSWKKDEIVKAIQGE